MTAPALTWNTHTIRALERESIDRFVSEHSKLLRGRVLDFGAGKPATCRVPQPYRKYVEGEYVPIDEGDALPAGQFDAILCTQVLQYLESPGTWLKWMHGALRPEGRLILTYPTNWDEVEDTDLWRFTRAGMQRLLEDAQFDILGHQRRAAVPLDGFQFPLGYGVVARRRSWKAPGPSVESKGGRSLAVESGRHTTLTADESAVFLTEKLREREPFLFLRYGDGAIECIYGLGSGKTCDQERYSRDLGRDLKEVWDAALVTTTPYAPQREVYVGDWLSASFGPDRRSEYAHEYTELLGDARPRFLHFEALLLTRESQALLNFYRTIKADPRRKVYLGPQAHAAGARALGCRHVVTPMQDLVSQVDRIAGQLNGMEFDVLLWAAGMAGAIPVVRNWMDHPERTYINLGSALDPLYRGRTRSGQLTRQRAGQFFHGVL